MHTVSLFPSGPVIPRLGYGTASLMGRLGRRASLRLLERAYSEGIRYFDTAPAYGSGEAEEVVGRFARTRRDSLVLTTKVGLAPGRATRWVNVAKRVARPVLALSPTLRKRAGAGARSAFQQPVANFDLAYVRRSLDDSLRALGTQHVDILLLHECRLADLRDESLLGLLEEARTAGKIRAFGLGTDIATIEAALREAPAFTRVLQFASNAAEPNVRRIAPGDRTCVTHSPFGGVGRTLATLREGTREQRGALAGALLRYAVSANPTGIVLFAAQDEDHIARNVRALSAPADDDAALLRSCGLGV